MFDANSVLIPRPDDWHVHFRQDEALKFMVPHTARQFARALVMPNTRPPKCKAEDITSYDREIALAAESFDFTPYYALYLTPQTTAADVREAARNPRILGFKLYPQGGTTNAQDGISVRNITDMWPVLSTIAQLNMTLMIHGEIPGTDMFERERLFIQEILTKILVQFGRDLRITFEHITTQDAVKIVETWPNIAATVTAHHLLHNRNAIFGEGHGLSPHHFCLPVLKTEEDRRVIMRAATDHPRVFAGTDSAPHPKAKKESALAPAGCFTAPAALEMYAEAFWQDSQLEHLGPFLSLRGADWYRLGRNKNGLRLTRRRHGVTEVPMSQEFPFTQSDSVVCPWAGGASRWIVEEVEQEIP